LAWELRNYRLCYYRSRRTPEGKVVRDYMGSGPRAVAAAAAVARAKALREADRQALLEEQARLAGADDDTEQLAEVGTVLFEASLLVSGFHRQNYGPWRRKRRGQQEGN
jgi:hypothetical protein